jgi:hypothetical protein
MNIRKQLGPRGSSLPGFEAPRDPMADFLVTFEEVKALPQPVVAGIFITPYSIRPGGWTRMWNTRGQLLVYVDSELWEALPIKRGEPRKQPLLRSIAPVFPLDGIAVYDERLPWMKASRPAESL